MGGEAVSLGPKINPVLHLCRNCFALNHGVYEISVSDAVNVPFSCA